MGCICQQENTITSNEKKDRNKKKKIKKKRTKKKDKKSDIEKSEEESNETSEEVINSKTKDKILILLQSLFKSYYSAKTYFNENELKEKEVDAINCCRKINSAIELLKEGQYKKIKMSEMPKKIDSKYITDYTPEDRKKKINELISLLTKEKEEKRVLMNIRIEQMKKKLKASKNLENDKLIVKKILDADKAAIDKINKDIEKIRLTLADDYIPVPLYRMISQPSKKEKLNLDIKENTMLIKVKNLTYTKSNPLIMLAIRGDDININKEIKGKNPEDINEEFTWVFNEKDFKNLVKYSIEIALGRTYSIKSTKVKGRGELPLRKLKSLSSLDEAVKLKMESGKPDKSIDIEIILRTPFIDKEYEDDFKEVVNIIKIYPKFVFSE